MRDPWGVEGAKATIEYPILLYSKKLVFVVCMGISLCLILCSLGLQALTKRVYKGAALVISEVMTRNTTTLFAEGETLDWIEIHNASDRDINLLGYSLTDSMDNIRKFVFPKVSLPSGGYLLVYASKTAGLIGGVHSAGFRLSGSGDTLYLFAPNATIVEQFAVPPLNADISYALRHDGSYGYCASATPNHQNRDNAIVDDQPVARAGANDGRAVAEYVGSRTNRFNPAGVFICEVCAVNAAKSGLKDWIELYNGSDEAINLSGYTLSDDEENPGKWRIPVLVIAAKATPSSKRSPMPRQQVLLRLAFHLRVKR
jgi:hypothetical protein